MILGFGTEDIDFVDSPAMLDVQTGSVQFRAGYSRAAFAPNNAAGGGGRYASGPPFKGGAVTSCWLHFWTDKGSTGSGGLLAGLTKFGHCGAGLWVVYNTSGYLQITTEDGAGNNAVLAEAYVGGNPDGQFDLHLENYGANSIVNLYAQGQANPTVTFEGDCRIAGLTNVDAYAISGDAYQGRWVISECIVADEDTRKFGVVSMYPSAAGDLNEWGGDGFGGIDEVQKNDTDGIFTETADKLAYFGLSDRPEGLFSIKAIKVAARAAKVTGATVGKLKLGVRYNSADDLDAGQDLIGALALLERYMTTIGGGSLTKAKLNAMQIAFKSAT